jgi:hypothetical protein
VPSEQHKLTINFSQPGGQLMRINPRFGVDNRVN